MKEIFYSLGLMSGTSLDGIDASIIKSDGENFIKTIDNMHFEYDYQFKSKLKKTVNTVISKKQFSTLSEKIKKIEEELTLKHAEACKLIIKKNKNIKIDFLGFHGQTILHRPNKGYSIQIGNSNLLSKIMNIPVISEFRKNDILNGGQGAPLAPLYHQVILNKIKAKLPAVVINIGGISNITYMKKNKKLISFDCGPGNYLIDEWIRKKLRKEFDKNGYQAKKGKVNKKILKKLLQDPYYKKNYPKSLDVKYFNLKKLKGLNTKDGSATLSMLTVETILNAINNFKNYPKILLITGGGRKNKFIFKNIKKKVKCPIYSVDHFKIDGDYVESQAFAYLSIRSYLKKNITFPNTTGVKKPCVGGIYFKI